MQTLDNGTVKICVNDHGAELSSISCDGREYLWQADPEFWGRHSPVLFPIVGMVFGKKFRSHGKEYTLGQHGFARDMDFVFERRTDDEVWFALCSDIQTKEKYPYDFKLEIGYRLEGRSIKVMWKVTNPSTEEDLYFQIGAHPAFHWPLLSDASTISGTAAMKSELADSTGRGWMRVAEGVKELSCSQIAAIGGVDPVNRYTIKTDDEGFIPLTTASFDRDAIVFEDSQVNFVTICGKDRKPYLTVSFDAPVVGIWSSPGKNAPFVCIEPWYGRADDAGYDGLYENKKWIQKLGRGESRLMSYTITVE